MNKATKKTANTIGFMIVFSILIIASYYYVKTRTTPIFSNQETKMTELEILLNKDLEINYPASPREVLNLYNRITKVLYNEKLKDEEIDQLAEKLFLLLDDELSNNKKYEEYILDLKAEMASYKDANKTLINHAIEPISATIFWQDNGMEYASLSTSFSINRDGNNSKVIEDFIFRKDKAEKWKILGWRASDKKKLETE